MTSIVFGGAAVTPVFAHRVLLTGFDGGVLAARDVLFGSTLSLVCLDLDRELAGLGRGTDAVLGGGAEVVSHP